MKKVLIIDNSSHLTGAFKSIYGFIQEIPDVQFVFCIPYNSTLKTSLPENSYFTLPFIEIQRSWKILLYFPVLLINSFRIFVQVKKRKIQVIHVNDMYNMCGIIVKMCVPSLKLIHHIRLLPSSYSAPLYSVWKWLIVKAANHIICVSQAVRKNWPDFSHIHVIHDAFPVSEDIVKPDYIGNPVRFLYLSNYIKGKGQEYALEAFRELTKEGTEGRLIFAGSDMGLEKNKRFKETLIQQAKSFKIEDRVVFKDFIKNVESEIKEADVFLNFSDSESFSMTCLESSFFGTPVIATDCGGPSEIIENEKTGFIVPVKNIDAMKNAMLKLASDTALRQKFSKQGQIRVAQFFNIQNQAKRLTSIYNTV